MKKFLSLFLVLCLTGGLAAGCQNKDTSTPEVLDVDLTVMSSTMVYAEVYNMMVNPDDYIGKIVKMRGSYYAPFYEETNTYYHYVIIEDATACCTQGIEFIWNGEHNYPGDYPAENTEIELVGIFGSYEELGTTYYCLAVDQIEVLN